MNIYQRFKTVAGERVLRSPCWYVDVVRPDGRRCRVSTKEKTKAGAKRRAWEIECRFLEEAKRLKEREGTSTLGDALDAYVAALRARGASSGGSVASIALKLVGRNPSLRGRHALDPAKPIDALTPADLEQLVQARGIEGTSAATIHGELRVLRSAIRYAAGMGHRGPDRLLNSALRNPWRLPKVPQRTRYLSWQEWLKLFAWLDPDRSPVAMLRKNGTPSVYPAPTGEARQRRQDVRDLLVMLTLSGGRWSEIRLLTWDRVATPDCGRVRLRAWKTATDRLVPVPAQMRAVLRRRWEERGNAGQLVFPGHDGLQARHRSSCKGILRAIDACGLNAPEIVAASGRATVHSLRHTFASWLIANDADLLEVKEALGHASVVTTQRYAHLARGRVMERLGRVLDGVAGAHELRDDKHSCPITSSRLG